VQFLTFDFGETMSEPHPTKCERIQISQFWAFAIRIEVSALHGWQALVGIHRRPGGTVRAQPWYVVAG
jgi:hypothetical protein